MCVGADLFNIFVKYCSFGKPHRLEEMSGHQVSQGAVGGVSGCCPLAEMVHQPAYLSLLRRVWVKGVM